MVFTALLLFLGLYSWSGILAPAAIARDAFYFMFEEVLRFRVALDVQQHWEGCVPASAPSVGSIFPSSSSFVRIGIHTATGFTELHTLFAFHLFFPHVPFLFQGPVQDSLFLVSPLLTDLGWDRLWLVVSLADVLGRCCSRVSTAVCLIGTVRRQEQHCEGHCRCIVSRAQSISVA